MEENRENALTIPRFFFTIMERKLFLLNLKFENDKISGRQV